MPIVVKSEPTVLDKVTSTLYKEGNSPYSNSKTNPVVHTTYDYISHYSIHNMEGRTTPGWQKMRNAGAILPMTVFKQFQYESFVDSGERDYYQTVNNRRWWWSDLHFGSGDWWGRTPAGLPEDDIVTTSDLEYLVQQAAGTIASSGWDALTFIAELKQLRRMFSGVVSKLDNLSRGLSPGKAYDLWLEGRYGWRVLTYDVRDLHNALVTFRDKRTRYNQRVGNTFNRVISSTSTDSDSISTQQVSEDISIIANLRGTVVADVDVPKIQFNPVVTAWEVTRLSFVVDWLLNVGQALNAASFLYLAKDYQACGGFRLNIEAEGTTAWQSDSSGYATNSCYGSYRGVGYYEERVPLEVSILPRLRLRMTVWKAVDLLALIAQRL